MRNWNSIRNFPISEFSRVFTLPMRNWNQRLTPLINLSLPSFYFTYEELKLLLVGFIVETKIPVFTLPMRNWNYAKEILMLNTLHRFLLYLWGIETNPERSQLQKFQTRFYFTYEELKRQSKAFDPRLGQQVFTLPMRNWNARAAVLCCTAYFLFLLYLWGIET